MDTSSGGGQDSRFNMVYNLSLLSGESSQEIYNSSAHNRPSTSLNSPVSRPSMTIPSSCSNIQRGVKRTSSDICFDQDMPVGRQNMSSQSGLNMTDCSSDAIGDDSFSPAQKKTPPPNGKKTKGRVKIKMEYIDNKLRRYTTFSKRKTGIMKKAFELSTLTGTQVMLLVASETGHVYTFATRKLQPMITSEAGKALIQTCLNSPDPPPSGVVGDQRMSATGFEETELTYNIGDDDQQKEGILSPGHSDSGDTSGNESAVENDEDSPSRTAESKSEPSSPPDIKSGSSSAAQNLLKGVMYPTPQGLMYSGPGPGLPNGVIFSLNHQGQLQLQESGNSSGSSQTSQPHFITIPLPMALSAAAAAVNGHNEAADLSKNHK